MKTRGEILLDRIFECDDSYEKSNRIKDLEIYLSKDKPDIFDKLSYAIMGIVFICFVILLGVTLARAQTAGDGIPEPDRANPEFRLISYSENGQNVFEYISVPTLIRDFGKVSYIDVSPNDPNRNFDNLPNFGQYVTKFIQ